MDEVIKLDDIYIGFECKNEYSEFLGEYELWKNHVILMKTDYYLSVSKTIVQRYENIETCNYLYINNNGFVVNSRDEITNEKVYHQIHNLISLKDLLVKYESDDREDCQYQRYIAPIYEKVLNVLKNRKSITISELNAMSGNLYDIHTYVFGLIKDEEYEDLFGCRIYSFDTGKRIKR